MEVNITAVIVATITATVLGMLWYGPLFGKLWMQVLGVSPEDIKAREKMKKGMMPILATQVFLTLFQVYVLAHFINAWSGASGIETALWIWAGFVMPMVAATAMWNNDSEKIAWTRFLIQGGYQLVCFVMFGAILGM